MIDEQVLHTRQGIWIDESWLRKAGLGTQLRIQLKEGEICIQAAPQSSEERPPSDQGWDVFRTLGDDAPSGSLENAARHHDLYLYTIRHNRVICF